MAASFSFSCRGLRSFLANTAPLSFFGVASASAACLRFRSTAPSSMPATTIFSSGVVGGWRLMGDRNCCCPPSNSSPLLLLLPCRLLLLLFPLLAVDGWAVDVPRPGEAGAPEAEAAAAVAASFLRRCWSLDRIF